MSEPIDAASAKRCVHCGKPAAERFRPFCSKRCADVDLHRWFSGTYAVPAAEEDDAPEMPEPEEGSR